MTDLNSRLRTLIGGGTVLLSALALSGCGSNDKASAPVAASSSAADAAAAPTATASDDAAAVASAAAEDMHNRMDSNHRQEMDHDSMRMGPGMNHQASPTPSSQPQDQNNGMQSGVMKDM